MAITATGRVIPQTAGATSMTSGGTMTPTSGSWFIGAASVSGTAAAVDGATFTMSGALPTWTLLDTFKVSVDGGADKLALVVFYGLGDGGAAHTVTFSFGASSLAGAGVTVEFTGTDVSGTNGVNAIVQHPTAANDGGSTGTTASASNILAAFGDAVNNLAFALTAIYRSAQTADGQTPKTGWTEASDRTNSGNPCGMEAQYFLGEDRSTSSTWANASNWIQAGIEIKAASGASALAKIVGPGGIVGPSLIVGPGAIVGSR